MADLVHLRLAAEAPAIHSEVGRLRTVVMHRPDLAHERITAAPPRDRLFDDVVWVRGARQEFDALVELLHRHGVEVLLLHDLLSETLEDPAAREWLLSRRLRPEEVTAVLCDDLAAWMRPMPAAELAARLTEGVTARELPADAGPSRRRALRPADFVIAPVPNQLFTRDTSAWVAGGVALATMTSAARRKEALNLEVIYRHHPRFRGAAPVLFGGADHDWGEATLEGGDVMALGEGVVLVGQGDRTSAAAASILAANLFAAGAARLVIGARLPRAHASRHLDTALAFCDRDVVAVREPVVSAILPVRYRPDGDGGVAAELSERLLLDELRDELGLGDLRVIAAESGELDPASVRSGAGIGIVAVAPGVVVADERNENFNHRLADAGVEVHAAAVQELARARDGAHCITCPILRDA